MEVTRESCRKKRSAHKFSSITCQLIVGNASVRCLNSPTSTNSASSTMLAERSPRVRESSISARLNWPSSAVLSERTRRVQICFRCSLNELHEFENSRSALRLTGRVPQSSVSELAVLIFLCFLRSRKKCIGTHKRSKF